MKEKTAFETRYVLLLLCYLLGSATLTIIAPIMPYQMKEKNIPTAVNSIVFCVFSLAGLMASIYTSKFLAVTGEKVFVYGGLFGLALAHLIYALLSSVYDQTLFVCIIIANRILEGWAFGLIQCMVYGISSQELPPKEFDKFARTCSASAGLGGCISLILGPFLFSMGGYFLPYFVLSGSFIVLVFIINASKILNDDSQAKLDFDEDMMCRQYDTVSVTSQAAQMDTKFVMSIPAVKYGCLSILLSNIVLTYLDPIFALKMLEMDIFANHAGYIYIFLLFSYSFFGFSGGLLEKIASKRHLIIAGYLSGFIGFCVIAHELFLGANFLPLIIIGLFVNGFSVIGGNMFATMYTKSILMEEGEKVGVSKKVTGGYFGGLKGSCNLIGTFIGPLISPPLYLTLGFEKTCILMGFIQVAFVSVFYFKSKHTTSGLQDLRQLEIKEIQLSSNKL